MAKQVPTTVSISRLGIPTKTRSAFTLKVSEDLFSDSGAERVVLTIAKPHHRIYATMTPIVMRVLEENESSRNRWAALIAEAIVRAEMAGAVMATLEVKGESDWFRRLARECGFETSTRDHMTILLDQPEEEGK